MSTNSGNSKSLIRVIVAIIGLIGMIILACGGPFASRIVDIYLPAPTQVITNSPTTQVIPVTQVIRVTEVAQVTETESVIWQLNPVLSQPQGFTGWISSKDPRDFESGVWTQGVNVSIDENQLLLVFGGLAKLPAIGEIGTRTSCFVIASRGPLNLSLDLMSARLEVHNVDATATSLAWAAQKVTVMQEVYPSTCGKGLDIAVGK